MDRQGYKATFLNCVDHTVILAHCKHDLNMCDVEYLFFHTHRISSLQHIQPVVLFELEDLQQA